VIFGNPVISAAFFAYGLNSVTLLKLKLEVF